MCIRDRNESVHKFKNVGLVADVRQRVIVHGLGKVDAVKNLDLVPLFLLEKASHLGQHPTLGINHHERGMSLQKLGREPKP